MTDDFISRTFGLNNDDGDLLESESASLRSLYGIVPGRPSSCRTGTLDLLNDVRFTIATETLVGQWRGNGRQVFRYLVDEANPWQPSSRAHHTVDLPLLFGSYDLSFNPGASRVSYTMTEKWINFVAGSDPWDQSRYFALGPLGNCAVIDDEGFAVRRRKRHCDAIRSYGVDRVDKVWLNFAKGNISLEN